MKWNRKQYFLIFFFSLSISVILQRQKIKNYIKKTHSTNKKLWESGLYSKLLLPQISNNELFCSLSSLIKAEPKNYYLVWYGILIKDKI